MGKLLAILSLLLPALATLDAFVHPGFIEEHAGRLDRLMENLDPDNGTMHAIVHQWKIGNRTAAAEALAGHFREKPFPVKILEPLDFPDDLEMHARAALGDSFFLLSEWETVARREDGGIDWLDRGERNDKERAWMLNRHGFLPDLAEAWARTGDERYRKQLNELWQDWILSNPYPDRLSFSPPWRGLEVARRLLNAWVHVFYGYDVLTDETRLLVLASLLDHGDALREHASFWGGNHLISEKLALLTLSAAWPELEPSNEWQEHAISAVTGELFRQTYPDGSYKELSNHYQRVVLINAQYFLSLLSLLDPEYRSRPIVDHVETMWDYFARIMRPDGSGPLSNASDREFNASFIRDVWPFFDREDWLYMAGDQEAGQLPVLPPSHLFAWAGQAILRSSWEKDADWIYLDAGPYGSAHQHMDHLHISASIGGRPVLVDSGRYTYQPGPWRDFFKGAEGHNTLLLDNRPAEQGPRTVDVPMPVTFLDDPEISFAGAATRIPGSSGPLGLPVLPAPSPWSRAVLLDKRGIIVVMDHIVTFQDRSLAARWHFHPDIGESEAASLLRLAHPAGKITRTLLKGVGPPDVAGYFSPEYNIRKPAVEMQFRGRLSRPTTLVWVLQDKGEGVVEVEVLSPEGSPELHFRLVRESTPLAEGRIRLFPEVRLLSWERL